MSRFFNVKDDYSAGGESIIWDEQINILQPEVAEILDQLRDGQEITIPLKPVAAITAVVEEKEEEKGCWTNPIKLIYSFILQCISYFGIVNPADTDDNTDTFSAKEKDICAYYSSDMPLLEEHQNKLSEIWSTIKSKNSIITGRRTIRRLAQNSNCTYTLKKIKYGEQEYYILHQPFSFADERNTHSDHEKLAQVYATLTQSTTKSKYTGYFYQSMKHGNYRFHYTSEIDAHWNSEKFEIKVFTDHGYRTPFVNVAFRAAIQCHYSDVKDIIFGFYTDTHITLKLYTCEELIQLGKRDRWNVNKAKNTFKANANQIIKFIKENDDKLQLGKTVKITKSKRNMAFDFEI